LGISDWIGSEFFLMLIFDWIAHGNSRLNWRWEFGDWIWIGFLCGFSREDLINEIVDHAGEKPNREKLFFDMFCWSSQLSRIE
jgi:hypothetical protein